VVASSPQQAPSEPIAGVPTENQVSPEAVTTRQLTRSTRGVAPQRMRTYEVKGQPTAYFLEQCFQTMIEGLVDSVHQWEYQQRELLAMMSSIKGTIETWPQSLREYPKAFKAGNNKDPDLPNFMEAMTGEHGEEYQEAMDSEMQSLQKEATWEIVPRCQVPRATNVLPLTWVYKLKCYPDGCPRKFKA